MNQIENFFTNKYVYIPLLTWFFIQAFKVIYELIKFKKLNFKRIIGPGGMPSSHSAVVCSLAVLIGNTEGFNSPIFALSVIFAMVVMYDAAGVRRSAGKQAALLNKILQTPNLSTIEVQEKLVEVLGHSPKEVFVGAIIGVIIGFIF